MCLERSTTIFPHCVQLFCVLFFFAVPLLATFISKNHMGHILNLIKFFFVIGLNPNLFYFHTTQMDLLSISDGKAAIVISIRV